MRQLIYLAIIAFTTMTLCQESDIREIRSSRTNTSALIKIANKMLYFNVLFKLNWYKAEHFCRSFNMKLVGVESEAENLGIIQYLKENGHADKTFFTSGNDLGEEGQFYWFSNGRKIGYSSWSPGDPNNLERDGFTENCLLFYAPFNLQWVDGHCHVEEFFICEV